MNPHTTIIPWLEACGSEWGLEGIEEEANPDPSGQPEHIYATYSLALGKPAQAESAIKMNSPRGTHDILAAARREYIVDVVVHLYNSQNGLAELIGSCLAAEQDQDIVNLFKAHGVTFREMVEVRNKSIRTAERIWYHHILTCRFSAWYTFGHFKTNERIATIDISKATTE